MARLYTAGAEIEAGGAAGTFEGTQTGSPTRDTGTKRSGAASFKCDSGASVAVYKDFTANSTQSASHTYSVRAYLNFTNLPGATVAVLRFSQHYSARVTSAGKVQFWDDTTGLQVGSDSAATLSTGTWYRFEIQIVCGATTFTSAELRLDGTTVASDGATAHVWASGQFRVGWLVTGAGTNKVLYIDDVAINDDTGSSQTSWCGDGKVVLLVPISDNARDAKWTGGAGGTTNLWDAVNNTPPAGLVSASATNTSQIEHAGTAAGTTDKYDANLTTYTTAGIASGDTINLVQWLESCGEDIATGTKLLDFEVLSNPTIASPGNVTAGLDVGAVGTYPTNWDATNKPASSHKGPITYSPSVTLGTSPVMRVRRPETAARVASVCFMGMYVDYTEFVSESPAILVTRRTAPV